MTFHSVPKRQARVLDAYVRLGNYKKVADELHIAPKTVLNNLFKTRRLLGIPNNILLAVAWDRHQRSNA